MSFATKALAAAIRDQLVDQRLVGTRGDGQAVNWLGRTAAGSVVGVSSGADVVSQGPVTRTSDRPACAAL